MSTKITYATLGGEQLEDLHRALDDAIAAAPATFGREYFLYINGQQLSAEQQFEDRSPIDTGVLIGRFQQGTREHARQAVAAARRRVSCVGGATMERAAGAGAEGGGRHSRAPVGIVRAHGL